MLTRSKWFADPVFLTGDWPSSVKAYVSKFLPEFTDEQKQSILGSGDFFAEDVSTAPFQYSSRVEADLFPRHTPRNFTLHLTKVLTPVSKMRPIPCIPNARTKPTCILPQKGVGSSALHPTQELPGCTKPPIGYLTFCVTSTALGQLHMVLLSRNLALPSHSNNTRLFWVTFCTTLSVASITTSSWSRYSRSLMRGSTSSDVGHGASWTTSSGIAVSECVLGCSM
jgi:hypothetical protein